MKPKQAKHLKRLAKLRKGTKHSFSTKNKIRQSLMLFYETVGKRHYNIGVDNPNWNGGIQFIPYPLGWNKTFKEQIRYRDSYTCQMCGCSELENIKTLSVHHIDYDKKNIKENNLISLCRKCHTKTNYNRKYWMEVFS